jgi:tripartite-type tricarboxylate transporter receptor subunit TctC
MEEKHAMIEQRKLSSRTFLKAIGLALATPGLSALAQTNPARPIRVVVPLPPGSSNDTSTRAITPLMSQALGQAIVVDNKAGGNGVIGTMEVVRSPADGLTLLAGSLSPLAANVALMKNLPYDPLRDLTPVAGSTLTNHVLVVRADSPIRTFADFLAYAKQRPGRVSIGHSTALVQLQIASINKLAGVELMPVPYKGAPATVTDVIAGILDATMANPGPAMEMVKGGRLRALGVTSLKRNPTSPDWPALSETLPGFDFPAWNAFVGPAGMPRALVNRLSEAIAYSQRQASVAQQLAGEATVPLIMGPDELKVYMAAEVAKFVRLAKEAGIQPE